MIKKKMKSQFFLNSLIGTNYEKNQNFLEIYDMKENNYFRESMDEITFEKDFKNLKNDDNIKFNAYCFDCGKNINLEKNHHCKNHNIKLLNDLNKNIDIELTEEKLEHIEENYKIILKYLEEKIINLKKRNNNQIILAKKIIEAYKLNINNLNYQIISNVNNILNFNYINSKSIIQKESHINLDYNILQ